MDQALDPFVDQDAALDAPTLAPHSHDDASESSLADEPTSPSLPSPGTLVHDYVIESEIARGAMGVVYRARHRELGRLVALKMLLDRSDIHLQRFAAEAKAAAKLEHPGIVPVHDVGEFQGIRYLTMPLIEGPSLAKVLTDGPLASRRSAEIAMSVARAVDFAHQHGIIHRDLKPANILIDRDDQPRVTDFGVSKSLLSTCDLTSSGEVVGTPHYMPPEQASAQHNQVGPTADVYAIGAILYAMLTGRPPFQAASPIEVIAQVLTQTPVAPRALNASVPRELDLITLKCLSKAPRDRYPSASQLADDLQRFLAGEPIVARPPSLWRQIRFYMQRHVLWASVSGSAAMVLVLLTLVMLVNLVRLQSRVLDLEDQLSLANRQFGSERASVKQFLNSEDRGAIDSAAIDQLELNRLVSAVELVQAAEKPQLALELAIEVVRFAEEKRLDIPVAILAILREETAPGDPQASTSIAATSDDPLAAPEEVPSLVDAARRRIIQPMSDTQRALFGLPPKPEPSSP